MLVPVPEAEPVVGRWRELYDPSAGAGVPAHVTLLYPFVPAEALDSRHVVRLQQLFARFGPFNCVFERVESFGDQVLYLAPNPAEPFVDLTRQLVRLYPDYPPYGGAYPDVVPHLTVAHRDERADLELIRREVEAGLPIHCAIENVWLMAEQTGGRWRLLNKLGLARS